MLVIRQVALTDALTHSGSKPPGGSVEKALWDRWSRDGTLRAFVAEWDGAMVGLAIAESHPRVVRVLCLEGDAESCRHLLDRLVRLAGERDMSVWCPTARLDILGMLEGLGFAGQYRDDLQGRPSLLYHWSRNEDVREEA